MIGIFDSGIGGLTTVKAISDRLPFHDIVYYGDTARTPYGSKSRETVITYAKQNTDFLLSKGAKIIVMACNTASSVAADVIASTHENIPVFEVIQPAVAQAARKTKKNRIGVIGTRGTIRSGIYPAKLSRLNPEAKVYSEACPLLVPLVEEGWFKRPETRMIVKKYLRPLKEKQVDTLILGCTHYPLLKSLIQLKIGKGVQIIDSAEAVADTVVEYLKQHPETDSALSRTSERRIYVSDVTDQFGITAETILKHRVELLHV